MMSSRRMDDVDDRWSKELPDELIEMIVKRLTLVDSIRFAAVCPSWRSVSSQWFQRVTRLPWLLKSVDLIKSSSSSETDVNYSVYSPSEDTAYNLKFPRASASSEDISCSGCANGWLIMSEITKVEPRRVTCANYLLNPMTGDRINLPVVTDFVLLTSTASSDPRSSNCIVATKYWSGFYFCRPGSQKWSWTTTKPFGRTDAMKFHHDGKLYVTGRDHGPPVVFGDYYVLIVFVPVLPVGKGDMFDDEEITWYKESVIKLAPLHPWTGLEVHAYEPCGPMLTLSSKGKPLLVWRTWHPQPDRRYPPFHAIKNDDGWPGWKNSMDIHVVVKGISAVYDASEDELVLIYQGHGISVSNFKSLSTRPTIDERFYEHHCRKLSAFSWDTTEDGQLDYNIDLATWFTPNLAK